MANVPTTAWAETTPAGSDNVSAGDNRIREMKTQIREVVGVDHDFPSSGQAADNGQHLRCTFQEQADLGTGAEGTTILGNQTVSGKGELVYTDEDDNDVQITSGGKLYMADILEAIYPVGSVITLGVSTNPATLLGIGTWTAIAGKVIVGISASDTEFDTLNETGGAKSVTLTGAQSGQPATSLSIALGGNSDSDERAIPSASDNENHGTYTYNISAANAVEAHTNLQPYIVKYVWERTA